jgi:phage gp29-like protein
MTTIPDRQNNELPDAATASEEIAGPTSTRIRDPWEDLLDLSGLTPARVIEIQAAARAGDDREFQEYAEQMLERDPSCAAHWGTLRTDVHRIPLQVHPASDEDRDAEIAEWVRTTIVDQESFQALRWDLLDGAWRGYSVVELGWKPADDWSVDYTWRFPHWFVFDRATGTRLLLRTLEGKGDEFGNTDHGEELALGKWICFAPRFKTGLIVRSGFAWPCMALHLFASYVMRFWMSLAEGHGKPMRLAYLPDTHSPKDRDDTVAALKALGYNAAAVFKAGTTVEFPDADIEGHSDFHKTLSEWLAAQMALVILGSNFMNESGGSFAKANALGDRLDNRVIWLLQRLDATLNEQLIKLAVDIQFGPQEAYPEVHGLSDEVEDANEVAISFFNVAKALGKPLPVREAELRKRTGWTEPEEGDRLADGDTWGADGKPEREDLDAEAASAEEMRQAQLEQMRSGDGDGDGDEDE